MSEDTRIVTCVYCGMAYPDGTPRHGSSVLTEHIKICPEHPMREAEEKINLLRSALIGLVGSSDTKELQKLEGNVRLLSAPDEDKISSINAIHALLKTQPKDQDDE